MGEVQGLRPDGTVAFRSRNLRGILDYRRKHDIVKCEMWHGEWKGGRWDAAFYRVTFADGVTCKGEFADASVMMGFFLSGARVMGTVECERTVWNCGANLGRFKMSTGLADHVRRGPPVASAMRLARCSRASPASAKANLDRVANRA